MISVATVNGLRVTLTLTEGVLQIVNLLKERKRKSGLKIDDFGLQNENIILVYNNPNSIYSQ